MSPSNSEPANPDLKDIAVIVTGAARGMGRAMALGLARAGVRVTAADLPASHSEMCEVLDMARKQGVQNRIAPIDCDVTQWRDCEQAVRAAAGGSGRGEDPASPRASRRASPLARCRSRGIQ